MKSFSSVTLIIRLLIVLLLLFTPIAALAESLIREVRVGILGHDVDNLWSRSSVEEGIDFNIEVVFYPSWELWGGGIRPNFGITLNDSGDTSKIYGGGLWEYSWPNGLFVDVGAGVAIHNGETDDTSIADKKHLGSSVLFRVTFEAGFTVDGKHRLSVMFDHISNGQLADPNDGLDTLGIRYGILF